MGTKPAQSDRCCCLLCRELLIQYPEQKKVSAPALHTEKTPMMEISPSLVLCIYFMHYEVLYYSRLQLLCHMLKHIITVAINLVGPSVCSSSAKPWQKHLFTQSTNPATLFKCLSCNAKSKLLIKFCTLNHTRCMMNQHSKSKFLCIACLLVFELHCAERYLTLEGCFYIHLSQVKFLCAHHKCNIHKAV